VKLSTRAGAVLGTATFCHLSRQSAPIQGLGARTTPLAEVWSDDPGLTDAVPGNATKGRRAAC
jgi:hypothetical protein